MRRSAWLWGSVLAVACGGATPAAEEPDVGEESSSEPASEAASPDSAEAAETPNESSAEPGSQPSSSGELTEEDLKDVLQQVLEDPGLDRYLHLDVAGRLPLKISGPGLPAKLAVIKGSYHVKVVDGPASAKDPVLVFTKIERDGESVRLRYRYDVEGIGGSAVVFRKDGTWTLGSNRVIEK